MLGWLHETVKDDQIRKKLWCTVEKMVDFVLITVVWYGFLLTINDASRSLQKALADQLKFD